MLNACYTMLYCAYESRSRFSEPGPNIKQIKNNQGGVALRTVVITRFFKIDRDIKRIWWTVGNATYKRLEFFSRLNL